MRGVSLFNSWLAWPDAWDADVFDEDARMIAPANRPDGKRAVSAVGRAVRRGELPDLRAEFVKCTDCASRATDYDHRCYDLPLEVTPVCHGCNLRRGSV